MSDKYAALKSRIEKALEDLTNGRASMHVPVLDTDVDLVLYDCLELLERRERDKQEPDAGIYAELHRLSEEARGPDGFSTWKDAAIAERLARVKCETFLNQRSYDIDYLTAMAAFHSDDWHKMSPIKAYMHGWNARSTDAAAERDARRYRFLRDKDAFGADNEPGLVSWDELTELDLCEFDAAVDARLAAAGISLKIEGE